MTVTIAGADLTHAASQRAALERFIAERFRQAYGAQVSHFCAHLLGLRDAAGAWQAAAGYTPAASGALYLEHYLDRPVEVVLSAAVGERVPRERVVEVGNLASAARGFGGRFLPALRRTLVDLGYAGRCSPRRAKCAASSSTSPSTRASSPRPPRAPCPTAAPDGVRTTRTSQA